MAPRQDGAGVVGLLAVHRDFLQGLVVSGDGATIGRRDISGYLQEAVFCLPLPQDPRLAGIHRALQAHPGDGRGLADRAATLGMSERNLARLFGRTPGGLFA